MKIDRRTFAWSLTAATGAIVSSSPDDDARVGCASTSARPPRRKRRLASPPARVTKIRLFYPPNYDPNGPQAFPQSNMLVLVDTEAGITGVGQGGSPDTVRNVARSVIGKNAFETEVRSGRPAFMDAFYSPGKEQLHALGAIDLALWDIKGKALNVPLVPAVRRQGAPAHRAVCHQWACRRGWCRQAELQKHERSRNARRRPWPRAIACSAWTARFCRNRLRVLPRAAARVAPRAAQDDGPSVAAAAASSTLALRIREIAEAAAQIREGVGPRWRLDDRPAPEVRPARGRRSCAS